MKMIKNKQILTPEIHRDRNSNEKDHTCSRRELESAHKFTQTEK